MPRYSSHFPDPVMLVTVSAGKRTNVMTVAWSSPVSFKPPILMVSIAPKRFSHDLILEAGEFGVSVLADDQRELSSLAGTLSGKKTDKLARSEFKLINPRKINAPLIAGARAWYECKLLSHESIGDHTVFYGEVLRSDADESKSPLVLFNHKYYALGAEKGIYP
jgi:flavin reductase (DIM6/NTAB) family NADH-FMN oxidoreductase RutF